MFYPTVFPVPVLLLLHRAPPRAGPVPEPHIAPGSNSFLGMADPAKYAVANFDDEEDGEMLAFEGEDGSTTTRPRDEEIEALDALESGGAPSSLPTFPTKSADELMQQRRKYLYVVVPLVVILGVVAVTGLFRGHHAPKKPESLVLGVPRHNQTAAIPAIPQSAHHNVPTHGVRVVAKHPHDPNAFTQGLEYSRGYLWESTGLRGESSLRRVRLQDGMVEQEFKFTDKRIFGEGMTLHHNHHIFMLSWQAGRGFIFDQNTFKLIKEWHYKGEGWGLAMHDSEEEVFMSDGTDVLRVLEPEHLSEKRRIHVRLDGTPVRELNEIEWVCGEIWANVWRTHNIYRIDPNTGNVKAVVNCETLPLKEDVVVGQNVLNGIAFDWQSGRLWVTGKKWAKIYQIHVKDPNLDLTKCKP